MIKLFLLAAAFVGVTISVGTQFTGSTYKTALGFKFSPGAVTIKHFVKNDAVIEGLAYFWRDGFSATGQYKWHGDLKGARGLK
jgi:hypothetical protein